MKHYKELYNLDEIEPVFAFIILEKNLETRYRAYENKVQIIEDGGTVTGIHSEEISVQEAQKVAGEMNKKTLKALCK